MTASIEILMYINKRRSEPKSQIYSLSLTRNKAKKLTDFDKLFEGTLCNNDDLLTSRGRHSSDNNGVVYIETWYQIKANSEGVYSYKHTSWLAESSTSPFPHALRRLDSQQIYNHQIYLKFSSRSIAPALKKLEWTTWELHVQCCTC